MFRLIVVVSAHTILASYLASHVRGADEAPSINEIEERLLAERSRIVQARLSIAFELEQTGPSGTATHGASQTVWSSGAKIRIDEVVRNKRSPAGKEVPEHTVVTCVGCYSPDTIFEHSDLPSAGRLSRVATITDTAMWRRPGVPNPLLLGLTPKGYLRTGDIAADAYIGCKNRRDTAVSKERLNSATCWKVTFEKEYPRFSSAVTYYVSPAEEGSIVRIEEIVEAGGTKIVDVTDCTNEKDQASGIWFPREVCFERRKNGDVIVKEHLTVTAISFNEAAIDTAFSLGEIPILRPGTYVARKSAKPDELFPDDRAIWSGDRLVPSRGLPDKKPKMN